MELYIEKLGTNIADLENKSEISIRRKLRPSKLYEIVYINKQNNCYLVFQIGELELVKIKMGKILNKEKIFKRIEYLSEKSNKKLTKYCENIFNKVENKLFDFLLKRL